MNKPWFTPLEALDGDSVADPGKDLFALLFLSFFLIATLLVLARFVGTEGVPVAAAEGGAGNAEAIPARLIEVENQLWILQGESQWLIPEEAQPVATEAQLLDVTGGPPRLLLEKPSDDAISAAELVTVVMALQRAGVSVELVAGAAP